MSHSAVVNGKYKNQGIEGISEYVKDITDFQKSAEDYYKARQSVKKGRMSTEAFERAYEERGWDRFDNKVTKTSAEDQKELEETWYGKMDQEGRRYWMSNPMNVAELAKQAKLSIKEYASQIVKACYLNEKDPGVGRPNPAALADILFEV